MLTMRLLVLFLLMGCCATAHAQLLDQYGGYTGVKGHNTSGFFRVEKIDGRYWLITPENNVLWSTGICVLQYMDTWGGFCPTLNYYPNPYGNKANYAGGGTEWATAMHARMDTYGFNTAACWGDGRVTSMTECITDLSLNGRASGYGCRMATSDFPDVWDPAWVTTCNAGASGLAASKNSPWRIGSFPYNECHWTNPYGGFKTLPDAFIAMPSAAYGKQQWVNVFLAGKYATIADLNTAYGTGFASWDDVLNATSLPDDESHPAILADKIDFMEDIADKYYSVATYYMRLHDPNHLVFTTRWAMWYAGYASDYTRPFNERIWTAAGRYCDVFANNGYADFPSAEATYQHSSRVFQFSKKPFMVTEHALLADDSYFKSPHGSPTQMDRAIFYADAVKGLLDIGVADDPNDPGNPAKTCMGMHWFQCYDEPSLGRPDNEACNFGLFNCQDEGFLPLLEVAKSTNSQIYDYAASGTAFDIPTAPTAVSPLSASWQQKEQASSFEPLYYMDHPKLLHQAGSLVDDPAARRGKAWKAPASSSTAGQAVTYGPYSPARSVWTGARYTVTYRLKTSDNSSPNDALSIDVAAGSGAVVLVSRTIKGTDFTAADTYQDFTCTFTVADPAQDSWQFRVFTKAVVDVSVDYIKLASPTQPSFVNGPLSDGVNTTLWSSAEHSSENATEWAAVYLGADSRQVSVLNVITGAASPAGMPADFRLEYSSDGTVWTPISGQSYTDFRANTGVNEFVFQPVTCNYLRICATRLRQDADGKYRLVLAGMDVIPRTKTATPTLNWTYSGSASSYTVLLSPVAHFPDVQTIRFEGITGTSYTPSVPLAQGTWYWTVKAVSPTGHGGKYLTTVGCSVGDLPFSELNPADALRCERLSDWRNISNYDTGGDGYSFAFLDDSTKSEGNHSLRVAITVNSLNKTTSAKNTGMSDIPFSYGGCGLDYSGVENLTFDIYPKRYCDSTGAIVPSTKYVRFRMLDLGGNTVADQAIDAAGALPVGQWSTITAPLTGQRRQVSCMEFYVRSGADKLTWDERVNFNIDNLTQVPIGDLTAPTTPVVNTLPFITENAITAVVVTQDPETGIADYQYAVGTMAGTDDILSWRSNGSSPSIDASGLPLVDGESYYVSAKAANGFGLVSDMASSGAIMKVSSVATLAETRSAPVGSWVALERKSVIASLADRLYVEQPDRTSGIGVIGTAQVSLGDLVSIYGQTQIVDHQLVVNGGIARSSDGTALEPVAMSNRASGGGAVGFQEAPTDNAAAGTTATGLSNTGCLVRLCGRATYVDPWGSFVYLDDGSGISDGSGHTGVRTDCSEFTLPIGTTFGRATGVMTVTDVGGICARRLRPRLESDLIWDSPAPTPANRGFELGTLSSWTSYGSIDGIQTGTWLWDITAHTRDWFFGTAMNGGTKSGGVYQRIAVPAGYTCQAAAWSRVYHSGNTYSAAFNRVGIDPTGGTSANSSNVKWSSLDTQLVSGYSEWRPLASPAVACSGGGYVTIFLDFKQFINTGWHINCFDDAALTVSPPGS